MNSPMYMNRRDAAHYIVTKWGVPCAPQTLAKLAVVGGGPAFRKAGRTPLYAPKDLDEWAESKIGDVQKSTADASAGIRPR